MLRPAQVVGQVPRQLDAGPLLIGRSLEEPHGRDRQLMSPSVGPPSMARYLSDPASWGAVALVGAATALAWWIGG